MKQGFPLKRCYPGVKGITFEFFNEADTDSFYQKGLSYGSRVEKQDKTTVIMKSSSAIEPPN